MLAKFHQSKPGAGAACARSLGIAVITILLAPAPQALAAKLGGPYYVDDAEIGKAGSCEVESWGSFAGNGDRLVVYAPACVVNLGAPVELGTNIVNVSPDSAGNSVVALTAKTVPIPISPTSFGVAVSGALVYDLIERSVNGLIVNVPLSYDFGEKLRFNVNVGAQYKGDSRAFLALAGAGIAWNFAREWSFVSEVFAFMGAGESNPRFQSGLRYSPTGNIDWDVIYGRNLTGEGANWITLALTVRIGD